MRQASCFVKVTRPKPRPLPVQARSKARREAVLDAAAEELDAHGFAGASMESVARRAGSSIGAVYRFFPDKAALLVALSDRCLERSEAFFASAVTDELVARPWREALGQTLRAYSAFYRADRSFRAVWRNLAWAQQYLRADVTLRQRYGEQVGALLRRFKPELTPVRARKMGALVVELTTAALMVEAYAEPLFDELTVALERYLAPEIERGRARGSPRSR
jgi:AcrR family transcriptional regulator